jgi:hypothetical protein
MSNLVRIAKGLKATYKNARDYTLSQSFLEIQKYTDNYEVLNADYNRMYGDIDGKNIESTEQEFNDLDMKTKDAIIDFLKNQTYSLLTSSSYIHRKISWRFVIINRKVSLEDNKKWVQENVELINLPKGVTFDSSPYGKNQKIRMVGSNKDGENRPLQLLKGDVIDTLISYIPEECELMELPKEKKLSKKKSKIEIDDKIKSRLLNRLVMNITNDETTEWEQWYKVAQTIYNEGGDEDLFLAWSSKSGKHNDREAYIQWKSLKDNTVDGKLTSGSIYFWSQKSNPIEHERIILECCSKEDYQYQKVQFEKTHFKLMNPPCYVRIQSGSLQYIKDGDLNLMYQNMYYGEHIFIQKWKSDSTIKTYESVVFKPKQTVSPSYYNIFTDFPCEAVEGDFSVMTELMMLLSGEDIVVFEYLENYFAHMFQMPYEKPGVCLVFSTSKQGAGKDTPLDFIGKILGKEYFFNTEDAENSVFGRFTEHLQKCILLKMEEVEFETNKKNESALLSLITASTRSYEAKGQKPITLDDYKRIVMTTNKSVPVNVPESDRRFVLINSSEKRVGDREFWNNVYKQLAKPETAQAYYYYLLNKDISQFEIRNRPVTDFYKEVKQTLRPYHAIYFQKWISMNGDYQESSKDISATDLLSRINDNNKFAISSTKFGRDSKIYPPEALTKRTGKFCNSYTIHTEAMCEFLKSKGWWIDE